MVETYGSNGAGYYYRGKYKKIEGYKAKEVVDTTGAGDAFWGGFLSYILSQGVEKIEDLNENVIEDGIRYGNMCGCLCIQKKGAIYSMPSREQVINELEKI